MLFPVFEEKLGKVQTKLYWLDHRKIQEVLNHLREMLR